MPDINRHFAEVSDACCPTRPAEALSRLLGIEGELRSDEDPASLVERRLALKAVEALQVHGLSGAEIAAIIIPLRTLSHRRAKGEDLSVDELDRAVRVARLLAQAPCPVPWAQPTEHDGDGGRGPAGGRASCADRRRLLRLMRLWCISNHGDLSDLGGLSAPGRWHSRGRPIVYCGTSPAACLLESLVRLELADPRGLPRSFQLIAIEVPGGASMSRPPPLPEGWRDDLSITRRTGDEWLRAGEHLLLAVPSAVAPETENVLFNPVHPDVAQACMVQRPATPSTPACCACPGPKQSAKASTLQRGW